MKAHTRGKTVDNPNKESIIQCFFTHCIKAAVNVDKEFFRIFHNIKDHDL